MIYVRNCICNKNYLYHCNAYCCALHSQCQNESKCLSSLILNLKHSLWFLYYPGVVIDGKSLEFAMSKELQKAFIHLARRCHSVLVCRATPLQKGEIVKLVKDELRVMTLAIGENYNLYSAFCASVNATLLLIV